MFGTGVWTGLQTAGLQAIPLMTAAAAVWGLAVLLHWRSRERAATLGVYVVIGLLGVVLSLRVHDSGRFSDLGMDLPERLRCTVEGVVNQDAIARAAGGTVARLQFGMHCDRLIVDGRSFPVAEPLMVTMYGVPREPPQYGERWHLDGTLIRGPARGGRQPAWRLQAGSRQSRRVAQAGNSIFIRAHRIRGEASAILSAGMEGHDAATGVVNALLLGYRARLPAEVQRAFTRTGTLHIFAISGLHVGILCAILIFGIGVLRVPWASRVFVLAPIIGLYTIATGSRASAIRAGIMAMAYLLAPALGRRPDAISALGLAGVCLLVWKPEQLMDMGFIFSFTAVAGILGIVPLLERHLQTWLRGDPLVSPEVDDPVARWKTPVLWVGRLASVSLAAWLSTAPLSLYFFGRLAPIALVANLIVVPLAFLILVTGCLSLAGGALSGLWLSSVFNSANAVFVRLLTGGMHVLEQVPYGHFQGLHFPFPALVLWYAVLVTGIMHLRGGLPAGGADPAGVAL